MSWNTLSFATRRWLLPFFLVALIVALWLSPHSPDCNSLAWESDPAIARVGKECIRLSDYSNRLRLVGAGIEYAERELSADDPEMSGWRVRHERVLSYGPETAALAGAVRDSALYQRAVADGHTPSAYEVSAVRDRERLRSEGLVDLIELVKLAQAHDEAGFTELLEESSHPDYAISLENSTPSMLMSALAQNDWRLLEQSFEESEANLEFIGRERYWRQILPEKLRREMAISMLESAILDTGADGPDGPYAEIPRLAWLAYQQEALEQVSIKLTAAAPSTVSADRALAFLAEVLTQEQGELSEEYRRLLQRRDERRRSTPPPPPQVSD